MFHKAENNTFLKILIKISYPFLLTRDRAGLLTQLPNELPSLGQLLPHRMYVGV
jgi:hypothetical protein